MDYLCIVFLLLFIFVSVSAILLTYHSEKKTEKEMDEIFNKIGRNYLRRQNSDYS